MNPIINYTIQFLIGGGIIVGMSILAKYVSPKYAAMLYTLPIQFTLAVIFIHFGTKKGTVEALTKDSLFYIVGFILFIISFYLLDKHLSFWASLGISYALLIGINLIITIFL